MIRFFSKMRYKLATENRAAKYLRYAVGEILLVMIGILMALQVNNWNTEHKNRKEYVKTIEALQQDLRDNIRNANHVIQDAYKRDSMITLVRNREVTREMYRQDQTLRNLIERLYFYSPIEDNLLAAINFENHAPDVYKPAIRDLKTLKAQIVRWENSYTKSTQRIIDYDNSLAENYSWYNEDDPASIEDKIDYLLNERHYENKVKIFKNGYLNNNVYDISMIRNLSVATLVELSRVKGNDRETNVNDLIQQLGLKPYEKVSDSAVVPANKKINFRISQLWYNASNQAVDIRTINPKDEELRGVWTLEPGHYRRATLGDDELVKVEYKNGKSESFRSVVDGYLLIE